MIDWWNLQPRWLTYRAKIDGSRWSTAKDGGISVGLEVIKSDRAPLTCLDENGERVPCLCMRIENTIYVHPDRWDEFMRAVTVNPGIESE